MLQSGDIAFGCVILQPVAMAAALVLRGPVEIVWIQAFSGGVPQFGNIIVIEGVNEFRLDVNGGLAGPYNVTVGINMRLESGEAFIFLAPKDMLENLF